MSDGSLRRITWACFRVLVLINPIWVAGFTFLYGLDQFWQRYAIGLTIAAVATLVGFTVGYGVFALEALLFRARGLLPPARGRGHGLFISAMTLPFSVFLGISLSNALYETQISLGSNLLFGSVLGGAVIATYALVDTRAKLRHARDEVRIKDAELERTRLAARVSILTAQMNPHLLFNTLNTVAERIHHDADAAEAMIVQIAELYRAALRASQDAVHSLADELALCELYIGLQRERFGERLRYIVELDPAVEPKRINVPSLVLQPLVENAIVHGLMNRKDGGCVRVAGCLDSCGLSLSVRDDGVGLGNGSHGGAGSALENLGSRLRLLYGERSRFSIRAREEGGVEASLLIPTKPELNRKNL
ncbi:MAG: histidine kinase [Pseudomonadota bacterium]